MRWGAAGSEIGLAGDGPEPEVWSGEERWGGVGEPRE